MDTWERKIPDDVQDKDVRNWCEQTLPDEIRYGYGYYGIKEIKKTDNGRVAVCFVGSSCD